MAIDKIVISCYDISNLSSQMTLLNALTTAASFDIESSESKIPRLRAEATDRLDAAANGNDDFVAFCRMIFDILRLQDKMNQDRNTISSLSK